MPPESLLAFLGAGNCLFRVLFAVVDADEGDQADQNHQTGGAEADDVFQIFGAIFFETHNVFLLIYRFFSTQPQDFCRQGRRKEELFQGIAVCVIFFVPMQISAAACLRGKSGIAVKRLSETQTGCSRVFEFKKKRLLSR